MTIACTVPPRGSMTRPLISGATNDSGVKATSIEPTSSPARTGIGRACETNGVCG
jgi:hypothetical protein